MKGLVFDLSIPKYVLAKGIGGLYPRIHYGPGSCLSLRELPSPTPPGPEWVRLKPLLAGAVRLGHGHVLLQGQPPAGALQ